VHQPVFELGARAAAGALGAELDQRTVLTTALVIRESCGCTADVPSAEESTTG
jgi:LacI family transcriptional regulator